MHRLHALWKSTRQSQIHRIHLIFASRSPSRLSPARNTAEPSTSSLLSRIPGTTSTLYGSYWAFGGAGGNIGRQWLVLASWDPSGGFFGQRIAGAGGETVRRNSEREEHLDMVFQHHIRRRYHLS